MNLIVIEYDNTICFASVNATMCLNLIGGTYSTAQKELYLSFSQFFSINQEKNGGKREKEHSTEIQSQGLSTAHGEHIWTAAKVDQHIPLSSTPKRGSHIRNK